MDIVLIGLLTLLAAGLGTLTGFGTSTLMVPILVPFYPLPQTLLLVGIVHFFTGLWRTLLFRRGLRWDLALKFGVPGVLLSIVGGWLMFRLPQQIGGQILGVVLLGYVVFILMKGRIRLAQHTSVAVTGGALYGLLAGIFGFDGAVRGAFLNAFDLPKPVYLAVTGVIALAVEAVGWRPTGPGAAACQARWRGACCCSSPCRSPARDSPRAWSNAFHRRTSSASSRCSSA